MVDFQKNTNDRTQNASNTYAGGAKNIEKDLKSIKDSSLSLAAHIKEDSIDIAKSAATELGSQVEHLKSHVSDNMKMLEKEVKERPIQSVGLAFIAGIAASYLLGGRR